MTLVGCHFGKECKKKKKTRVCVSVAVKLNHFSRDVSIKNADSGKIHQLICISASAGSRRSGK